MFPSFTKRVIHVETDILFKSRRTEAKPMITILGSDKKISKKVLPGYLKYFK